MDGEQGAGVMVDKGNDILVVTRWVRSRRPVLERYLCRRGLDCITNILSSWGNGGCVKNLSGFAV